MLEITIRPILEIKMCAGPDSESAFLILIQNKREKHRSVPLEEITRCLDGKGDILKLAKKFPFEANALRIIHAILQTTCGRGKVIYTNPKEVFSRDDASLKPKNVVVAWKLSGKLRE